jgi:S1-C subfamily serine protease
MGSKGLPLAGFGAEPHAFCLRRFLSTIQVGARLAKLLDFLSADTALHVAATARRVGAIRLGARQHLGATLWSSDLALTCGLSLPEQARYLLLLDQGHAIGQLLWRDRDTGLAALRLDTKFAVVDPVRPVDARVGGLFVIVGVDDTAQKVAVLAVLQNLGATGELGLDRPLGPGDSGGALIAASGALVGIVTATSAGHARVIPQEVIARLLSLSGPQSAVSLPAAAWPEIDERPPDTGPRGWLGADLQPVAVPRALRQLAGQNSGRLVIDVLSDGPAEQAGLAPGDIVLSIAEHSMVGSGTLREFLAAERIGQTLEMVLLREGELVGLDIVVGIRPAG